MNTNPRTGYTNKYLIRLERLREAVLVHYKADEITGGELEMYMKEESRTQEIYPEGESVWKIWLRLLKDIDECGLSYGYKVDGVRLYYYNELWRMVNRLNEEDIMDRAARLAKQPLPGYMWPEGKQTK